MAAVNENREADTNRSSIKKGGKERSVILAANVHEGYWGGNLYGYGGFSFAHHFFFFFGGLFIFIFEKI